MRSIVLKDLRFGSYLKLMCLNGLALGIVFGVLMLLLSLTGYDATTRIGSTRVQGLSAGLISLVVFPLSSVVSAFFFSLLSYLPFKLLMNGFKGIEIEGQVERAA
ncbi:tetrahydromethanopterin S-methyltransferase subunit F [Paenibacillus mucilaginosus]|uniref:hypothetical protein n=1 Tax=Paenibacillus mucilaginosus TaxID=61624 RepID=UPI003D208F9F